ncbi:MAG: hypothetical protein NTU74_00405 [Deltaproteobacteria bacterium]|nr:hypothetical protein [Deltaproteobacteria bacterium]
MATHIYDSFVSTLHNHFKRKLENISAEFNFDLGPEFEIAICDLLREFLPAKYGICRYIEAKHTLTESAFLTAVTQVEKVKKLCSQREPVAIYQVDPHIAAKVDKSPLPNWPDQRNPVFGMILSRYAVAVDGKTRSDSSMEVNDFLNSVLEKLTKSDFLPDIVVAGEHNYMSPTAVNNGENQPSLHYIPGRTAGYQMISKEHLAFGAGLSQLAGAMDWARLGRMPWLRIVNDSRFPEADET